MPGWQLPTVGDDGRRSQRWRGSTWSFRNNELTTKDSSVSELCECVHTPDPHGVKK